MQRLEKTRAFLTEFIIVILFFTVSAVITVQLFVAANKRSADSISITNGYLKAETMAERMKASLKESGSDGLYRCLISEDECGYLAGENGYYYQYFDKDYNVTTEDEAYILGSVQVEENTSDGGSLYSITIAFDNASESISKLEFKVYKEEVR